MTRKEIYNKILQMLEIEQNYLLKRYETGEIGYDVYVELSISRTNEYRIFYRFSNYKWQEIKRKNEFYHWC